MKIIVAGSRTVTSYETAKHCIKEGIRFLRKILAPPDPLAPVEPITIVSGIARGADRMGERFAREHGLGVIRVPARWDLYGKRAGYLRNLEMAEMADALIAIWDGKSRGTAHMINIMIEKGKPLVAFHYPSGDRIGDTSLRTMLSKVLGR